MNVVELPKKVIKKICRIMLDYRAGYYMNKVTRQKKNKQGKIKVGFLVQMPEVWDKQEPVYRAIVESPDFAPYLIIVPGYDFVNKKVVSQYGDEKFFFEKFAHEGNLIYAFDGNDVADLSKFNFDYVFYQRPYDWYLHPRLQSWTLVKYTKVCYIPYAFWWQIDSGTCGFNMSFYRNVYLGFMESEEHATWIQAQLPSRNHIVFRGYPVLENTEFEEKKSAIHNVLWTPRWTYSENIGGSHFFEYKDSFIKLGDEIRDISLIIRPHPLGFANFVAEGRMTEDDVNYFKSLLKRKNIALDVNEMIADTFKQTDVLLMDGSSIIIPFFLTGKPIILCDSPILYGTPGVCRLTSWLSRIMECLYVANDWDDVKKYLRELAAGNDYLYDKRREVASDLLHENAGATKRILDTLRKDYSGITQYPKED